MFKKEEIEAIKEKNPGAVLYEGEIGFKDEEGKDHAVCFIWRKPTVGDMEAFNKASAKNSFVAQSNLLLGLVVHPDTAKIAAELVDYPVVVADFVENQIAPFFGQAVVSKSRKI